VTDGPGTAQRTAWRIPPVFWLVAVVVLTVDWATKYAAFLALVPNVPHDAVGDVVRLTLAYDDRRTFWFGIPGTPYIALPGGTPVFYGVKLLIVGAMAWLAARSPRRFAPALGVLFGAGLANTAELIATGSVINLFDVGLGAHRWPTFNVADAALITTGLALALRFQREAVRERGWRRSFLSTDLSIPHSLRRDSDDPA
jgi:signal peptidase II